LIGRMVLDELREVDEVAYVRFASVYRSFQSVDEFFTLLQDLKGGVFIESDGFPETDS